MMYPLHRCKVLHLVRHGEGIHNVEGAHKSKTSPELFDASLSLLGCQQVKNLRKHVRGCGLLDRIELVVVSPLLRTLQTAAGVFGVENHLEGKDASPLTVDDELTVVSNPNCPPFIAHELCRERIGVNTCDKRRSISEYRNLFPTVDFSLIESDEDTLWRPDLRESDEELSARGMKFMNWLWTREEKEVAVVTHSAFLFQTLQAFGEDCHPSVKSEICTFFKNCELRSIIVVDKSLIASDVTTMNRPASVLSGVNLPNDAKNNSQKSCNKEHLKS